MARCLPAVHRVSAATGRELHVLHEGRSALLQEGLREVNFHCEYVQYVGLFLVIIVWCLSELAVF